MKLKCLCCGADIERPTAVKKYCSKTCGDSVRRLRWNATNPERAKERNRKRNSQHKLTIRNSHLKKSYGISRDQFSGMMASQGCKCLICKIDIKEFSEGTKHRACVDHDHDTGQVRGILCHACNRGLGQFADSLERLKAAVEYLQTST